MTSSREIRTQITSVKKIQKITNAMQNVAASKMRRAQERMETSMPYAIKICDVVRHVASSDNEYNHSYLEERPQIKKVGYILISTEHGLCGGLNISLFKVVLEHAEKFQKKGIEVLWCLFGNKAQLFFNTITANIAAHTAGLGESPKVSELLGGIKVMLDSYKEGALDRLFIVHNEFVSTMVQKPKIDQLLPLPKQDDNIYHRSYIYEPKTGELLDILMMRYIETQVYQAVVDNVACEQVARMLAMKDATDNSREIIEELQLIYNKVRQAAITREISEIVAGADAV